MTIREINLNDYEPVEGIVLDIEAAVDVYGSEYTLERLDAWRQDDELSGKPSPCDTDEIMVVQGGKRVSLTRIIEADLNNYI